MTVPARSPLMLVHGFTDTRRTWDPLVGLLEPHHDLLVPTLLGHRGGPPVPETLGRPVQAMVDELERTLDAAGHDRAHLVGSSLGGWLSLELAARGRALSVVAISPGHGWAEEVPRSVRRAFRRIYRLAPHGARAARQLAARPGLRRVALRGLTAHPERIPPATAVELIRGAAECAIFEPYTEEVQAGGFRDAVQAVDVPVRIAWGDRDRTLPRKTCSAYFETLVPDADWVELPGCGHLAQHDDPQLVARVVREWVEGAGGATPRRAGAPARTAGAPPRTPAGSARAGSRGG